MSSVLRIWLLHIGEQLPVDGAARPLRYSYLARAFQEAGHEVLRWAPTFCHIKKKHRFLTDQRVPVADNYAIQFVHSPGYRRNVGLERLRTYRVLGRRFFQLAGREPPPDLMVAAIPSLEWADAAIEYGRANGIPVVIDVRDPWPDVFLNALPAAARPAGRVFLAPYYQMARRACRGADALTAVSQTYLDWALRLAGRTRASRDHAVPLGFEPEPVVPSRLRDNVAALRRRGIRPNHTVCMFAGLFERSSDLETVVEAARRLLVAGRSDVHFVFCGKGSKSAAIHRRAKNLSNIHLLGWVDPAMLQAVSSISSIGLCAYARGSLQSLPNKPFEYMAGRLAIVSSLSGELAELLEQCDCGLTYRAGDAAHLQRCLLQVADNPPRLEALRSNSYQAWRSNYRSPQIYARFVDHLTQLTAAFRRAA
jgi:glycosyltransferase involved in cell wall biosynthesis